MIIKTSRYSYLSKVQKPFSSIETSINLTELEEIMEQQARQHEEALKNARKEKKKALAHLQSELESVREESASLQMKLEQQALTHAERLETAQQENNDTILNLESEIERLRQANGDAEGSHEQPMLAQEEGEKTTADDNSGIVIALQSELESLRKAHDALEEQLEQQAVMHAAAMETAGKEKADALASVSERSALQQSQLNTLCQDLQEKLSAWKDKREQAYFVPLSKLKKLVQDYQSHLHKRNDPSLIGQKKREVADSILKTLDDHSTLARHRLNQVFETIREANEVLTQHQDPLWMRFIRDCARIAVIIVSGLGFYHMATGKPLYFFPPSHGEVFAQDSLEIKDEMRLLSAQ